MYRRQRETTNEDKKTGSRFLVPALLLRPDRKHGYLYCMWSDKEIINTCLIFFTANQKMKDQVPLYLPDLRRGGFLPIGFFNLLVGKLVTWYELSTGLGISNVAVTRTVLILSHGEQRFRVEYVSHLNSIRVDVEGSPKKVMSLLVRMFEKIVLECFPSLDYVVLQICNGQRPSVADYDKVTWQLGVDGEGEGEADVECMFVSLYNIQDMASGYHHGKKKAPLTIKTRGRRLLDAAQAAKYYDAWLMDEGMRSSYDVFISYRWSEYDSEFTLSLFECLESFTIDECFRGVVTFLDHKRLLNGRRFDDGFAGALVKTKLAVPLISAAALERMIKHDASKVDNCLLEWVMMLLLDKLGVLKKIMPVVFGTVSRQARGVDGSGGTSGDGRDVVIGDFFTEGHLDKLPSTEPTATIREAVGHISRSLGVQVGREA